MGTTTSTAAGGRSRFGSRTVGAATTSCPCPVRVHIHLDANRDGRVDDRWWLNGSWNPGTGRLGAVVLCNCDDEDAPPAPSEGKLEDHTDNQINGADDNSDIAPFHLRKHPPDEPVPPGWKVAVEVLDGHQTLFRIFDNERAAGAELLGPTSGNTSFELTDLSPREWKYGMEVNQYPGRIKDPATTRGVRPITNDWDGIVKVKLSLLDPGGVVRDSEQAVIRCAPWVIFNHMDPTEEIYVVDTGGNGVFRADVDRAAGLTAKLFVDPRDQWMQDVMELGFSTLPKPEITPDMHLPVPFRTANLRGAQWRGSTLDLQIKTRLLGKNYGFYQALTPLPGSSLDSFGNLECVPPFRHPVTGVDYKFGRIVFGHSGGARDLQDEVEEFLLAQKVQFPFKVDTGWLSVGHIDEVLSFVPTPDGALGFKAVFAGPGEALRLLAGLPADLPCFQGAQDFYSLDPGEYQKLTVGTLREENSNSGPNIMAASRYAQGKIDQIKADLRREIGMTDADFIDLPVLFRQFETENVPAADQLKCLAYTAGSANMLVVTAGPRTRTGARTVKLCVPKPFGPTRAVAVPGAATGSSTPPCVFETAIAAALTLDGVSFSFIDDFFDYHSAQGEIHCGTNSKRLGPLDRFWWEQPGI